MSECPDELSSLLEEVSRSSLPDGVAQWEAWKRAIQQWAASAARSAQEEFSGFVFGKLWEFRPQTREVQPALLLFCFAALDWFNRHGWRYSEPRNVGGYLLPAAMLLALALEALGTAETRDVRREVLAIASADLKIHARTHLNSLSTVLGEEPWTFDGSTLVLGGLLELPLRAMFAHAGWEAFEELRALLRRGTDPESHMNLAGLVDASVSARWPVLGPALFEKWTGPLDHTILGEEATALLSFYSPARRDPRWFGAARERLAESFHAVGSFNWQGHLRGCCDRLKLFERPDNDAARALLDCLGEADLQDETRDAFEIVLDQAWSCWRQGDPALSLVLAWHESRLCDAYRDREMACSRWTKAEGRLRGEAEGELLLWLVARLRELTQRRDYGAQLALRSPERAAWRTEVVERLRRNPRLRPVAVEFLLWCAPTAAADDAELAALQLLRTKRDRAHLRGLAKHVSRTIQLRSRALSAVADGRLDIFLEEPAGGSHRRSLAEGLAQFSGVRGVEAAARTWLGDPVVEGLIHRAIASAERSFCSAYPDQWATEEERLIARLLEAMRHEFWDARERLRLAVEAGLGRPAEIELAYRETSKLEEGGSGLGTSSFGVDVAFIMRVEAGGLLEAERATFVQCKKLERDAHDGPWQPSLKVQPVQRDDLIAQTESAFYLFLVPPLLRDECWVVPARLVRALMEGGKAKSRLGRGPAARAAKSLANWLLLDIIGLWTGDERREAIERARGKHPGRGPRFLVEITARTGREGQG